MRFSSQTLALSALLALIAGCAPADADPKPPPAVGSKGTAAAPANPPAMTKLPAAGMEKSSPKEAPPLLLDDAPSEEAVAPGGADNSRCQVCHVNFMQEDLTKVHAKANVGCARCHGECDAHIADESWASGGNGTAPDIMYPKDKINAICLTCHPKDKIDAETHKEFLADATGKSVCVDCHGKHRMVARKCKWK
jgi:hypothetical protein